MHVIFDSYIYDRFLADASIIGNIELSKTAKLGWSRGYVPVYDAQTWGGWVVRGLKNRVGHPLGYIANASDVSHGCLLWAQAFAGKKFSIPANDIDLFRRVATAFRNQHALYQKNKVFSGSVYKAAADTIENYVEKQNIPASDSPPAPASDSSPTAASAAPENPQPSTTVIPQNVSSFISIFDGLVEQSRPGVLQEYEAIQARLAPWDAERRDKMSNNREAKPTVNLSFLNRSSFMPIDNGLEPPILDDKYFEALYNFGSPTNRNQDEF